MTDASHCAGPSFVQLGKALGIRVIAATKTAEERENLLSLGAEKVIVTEEQDLLMQINKITDNRGVDVVFDGLGDHRCRCLAMCLHLAAAWYCTACKLSLIHI